MEDLSALASRIVMTAGDLQGCLVLSRDGLVLGAYPPEAEAALKPAWLRFAGLGESDKGFVEFGDELWAYVRRGPYAAFAVAGVSVRPGLLIDQLEQGLLTAEESRSKRESLKIPDAATAPSGKPRTNLHKEAKPAPEQAPAGRRVPAATSSAGQPPAGRPAEPTAGGPGAPGAGGGQMSSLGGAAGGPSGGPSSSAPQPSPAEAQQSRVEPPPTRAGAQPEHEAATPSPQDATTDDGGEEEGEVDRVMLAQEFSRLLQESGEGDER
jgi:hypothetical protein